MYLSVIGARQERGWLDRSAAFGADFGPAAEVVVAVRTWRRQGNAPDCSAVGSEGRVEDVDVTTRPVDGEFRLEKINQLVPVFLIFISDEIVGHIKSAEADADVIDHVGVAFKGDDF